MMNLKTAALLLTASLMALQFNQPAQAGFLSDSEDREVGEFHAIDAGGLVRVYLSPAEQSSVRVEVRNIDFEDVITQNDGGVLTISTVGNHHHESVKVYVGFTQLNSVRVGGAATIYTDGLIVADEFAASTHGAGDIKYLRLHARRLDVNINDSGNARLDVDVDLLVIEMRDRGDLKITGRAGRQSVRSFDSRGTLKNSSLVISAR